MRATIKPVDGVIDAAESSEVKTIIKNENVVGFSIFDADGNTVQSKGVSDTTIAVFSNLFEHTAKIGSELGEALPRPSIMFSGRETELVALPLTRANVLILKDKKLGIRREYRDAS